MTNIKNTEDNRRGQSVKISEHTSNNEGGVEVSNAMPSASLSGTMEERFQKECCTVLNTGGIKGLGISVGYLETVRFINSELHSLLAEIVANNDIAYFDNFHKKGGQEGVPLEDILSSFRKRGIELDK